MTIATNGLTAGTATVANNAAAAVVNNPNAVQLATIAAQGAVATAAVVPAITALGTILNPAVPAPIYTYTHTQTVVQNTTANTTTTTNTSVHSFGADGLVRVAVGGALVYTTYAVVKYFFQR
jgi:hypothetical protein